MLDDEYLNRMAKLCGWQGTIVYNSLCRHANTKQESFPSVKLMAEQHGVSRPTIFKGIENLEKYGVIEVQKTRTKGGQWLNNTYILLDRSEWKRDPKEASQVNEVDTAPSQRRLLGQVNVVDTKETHKQGINTNTKILNSAKNEFSRGIVNVMDVFRKTNPSLKYGNRTQRLACEEMIRKFGEKETIRMATLVLAVQVEQYAPRATTPYAMWQKIADFAAYFKKRKRNIEIEA